MNGEAMPVSLEPIGMLHTCFPEKFGIPRQAGLASEANAELELYAPYNRPEFVMGLEEFSHIWVIFLFHRNIKAGWTPTVRPPRLGGNKRMGVFATRAPYRPNPIGLSALELVSVNKQESGLSLSVRGVDILDRTPVLDIKPYVPYADSLPAAIGGFAGAAPRSELQPLFSEAVTQTLASLSNGEAEHLKTLITQVLLQDPRPAYLDSNPDRSTFGMRLMDFNVKWRIEDRTVTVFELTRTGEDHPAGPEDNT